MSGASKISPDCLSASALKEVSGYSPDCLCGVNRLGDGLAPIQVLVNVDIFSEGFDCPDVEFVQLHDQRCRLPSICRWWEEDCE